MDQAQRDAVDSFSMLDNHVKSVLQEITNNRSYVFYTYRMHAKVNAIC